MAEEKQLVLEFDTLHDFRQTVGPLLSQGWGVLSFHEINKLAHLGDYDYIYVVILEKTGVPGKVITQFYELRKDSDFVPVMDAEFKDGWKVTKTFKIGTMSGLVVFMERIIRIVPKSSG